VTTERTLTNNRPSVLYVVFNEAFWLGVVYTQATKLVQTIQNLGHYDMFFLVFVPVISLWIDRESIREVRNELDDSGVSVILVPTPLYFSRYLLPRILLIPFYLLLIIPCMLFYSMRFQISILHPRGYMAGLGGLIVSRLLSLPLVFDPRSPFPEENVRIGNWGKKSLSFKIWKYFESLLVSHSTVTVATSGPFGDELCSTSTQGRCVKIPNNSGSNKIKPGKVDGKYSIDNLFGCEGLRSYLDKFVIAYVGTIGKWNAPSNYVRFHKRILEFYPDIFFLYIVSYGKEHLALELNRLGLPSESYAVRTVKPEEVSTILQVADVGLQLMREPDVRLGVKIADYLVAGLPVIVNEKALGAADLLNNTGAGLVINLNDEFCYEVLQFLKRNREGRFLDAVQLASERLSTKAVALQYTGLYNTFLESDSKEKM
jgi:glycosyltransferase involved in cell wall biosynthesis